MSTDQPISQIAADIGYLSEPAFNKTFQRVFGAPPGKIWKNGVHSVSRRNLRN
ncbi:helix-turn-helix domain-containing protein [Ruegeria atlantica]|uniref:helix-turn-helix domain-containing protein n=1 Tax=Ruegeria atlantica TaxID=81569 RepID=UPI0034A014A6